MYLYYDHTLYSFPLYTFLWPEDSPQWPKHVVVSIINRIQESCVLTYPTPSIIAYNTAGMMQLNSRPSLGPIQPPIQWVPWFFPKSKASGACCWPLPLSRAKGKNGWNYTSIPPICLLGVERDDYTNLILTRYLVYVLFRIGERKENLGPHEC